MKTLFIPTYRKLKPNKSKILEISKQLPKNIAIAYSIQYKTLAYETAEILKANKKHKITNIIQVLGCSKPNSILGTHTQAILLISSGKFHALSLALETKLPIYILEKDKLSKIADNEIEFFKKRQKAAYMKFLSAEKVGIIISTKPGQEALNKAIGFKNKLKKQGKKPFLFIANNINTSEFENFPDILCWVNTACPRLEFDGFNIVNIDKVDN